MTDDAMRCHECDSLDTVLDGEELNGDRWKCNSCGYAWLGDPPGDGPWRVGKKVGRTIYLNDQLVGLADTPELASMLVTAANVAQSTLTDDRISELRQLAVTADEVLKGKSRSYVVDAKKMAEYITEHLKRLEKIVGGDDGDGTT